jgi:hypothetical protein
MPASNLKKENLYDEMESHHSAIIERLDKIAANVNGLGISVIKGYKVMLFLVR